MKLMFFRYLFAISIALCLFGQTTVFGQGSARKAKIMAIKVEGNESVDGNLIKLQSGLAEGAVITGDDIQNAIKTLWELRIFSDVQILLDDKVGDNLYITIKVTEFPHLDTIQYQGNKKVKKKDLDKALDYYRGLSVGPSQVAKWRRQLLELYREKGYLLAEIEPVTEQSPTDTSRVNVKFKIHENNKVQVQRITFHGSEAFSSKKLRKQMKETKEDTWWRGADFDPDKFIEDKNLVLDFMRSKGYRDAEIVRDSLYYGPEKKDMFIDVWVNDGKKYYFGDISFEGNKLFTDEQLAQQVGYKEGDDYSLKKLQESVQEKLGTLYWDAGYIWAQINPNEELASQDTVNINYLINEGSAATIRKINIVGNTRTKDRVIRRELFVRPGQTFSRELLVRSARELWVLNYFSNVNPNPIPVDTSQIDILLEVEEKSTDTANMSAGWSERDKIIGSIGVAMNNLFGNGQSLGFDWNFGRFFRSFQISFTEPWLRNSPTLLGLSFYDTKRDATYVGYKQESRGGSVRIGRRLRWPDNFFRGDWIYRIDRTNLSDFIPAFQSFIREEDYPITSSGVTQIISRNSLNRAEFPTAGSNFSLSTEFVGAFFGGNVNYHKHQFKAEWFSPLISSLVLRSNFEAGVIRGFGSRARIPYLERFFLGGEGLTRSTPLRGYEDPLNNSASPEERIGGEVMLKYSFEVRLPISPNPTIYALAFAEAGNTWRSLEQTDFSNLRRSVGFGGRVFMPLLGMLGFDYAYGFDNIDPVTGARTGRWKPHFVFGRSF
ncbi:MAG: outer membrane protein assembly factor BamA [Deferribacteres bacterium]|nr:outer membrane protein assembly factor BamA [candidate division KSB1 bacterium]MCB9511563.1 outer membrane protein assembly factor BamA [Deferribacteres bacterium]